MRGQTNRQNKDMSRKRNMLLSVEEECLIVKKTGVDVLRKKPVTKRQMVTHTVTQRKKDLQPKAISP